MGATDSVRPHGSSGETAVTEPVAAILPVPLQFSRWLRRREDQLAVRFDCYNLFLDTSVAGKPVLQRASPDPAFVVAVLPAQHLAEQAFAESATSGLGVGESGNPPATDATTWPVGTRLAGESRLAFALPEGIDTIPFDTTTLLQWATLAPSLAPLALPRGAAPAGTPPAIQAPLATQTAIEVPWRLILSPHAVGRWAHSALAVTRNGRTELWHTRLAVAAPDGGIDERSDDDRTVRAIWATDPDFSLYLTGSKAPPDGSTIPANGLPFKMALTPKDRVQIVRASSDFKISGYTPDPVDVERLVLTSLGARLDLRGAWNPPQTALSIAEWRHRTMLGRDADVRVVQRGYLLPFGHSAAVLAISERKLAATPTGVQAAYVRQRFVLVVRAPSRRYAAFAQASGGRRFPFRRVTVTTTTTPNLDSRVPLVSKYGGSAFIPSVDGVPYEFHLVGQDRVGRRSDFTAPLVFVDTTVAFDETKMGDIRTAYNNLAEPLRRRPFQGQRVAIADSARLNDTDVEAASLTFKAEPPVSGQTQTAFVTNDQPRCHPVMATATIRLPEAERLSGGQLGPVDIAYDPTYVSAGFNATSNKGEVFAALTSDAAIGFSSERAGPITPGFSISGLSRTLGPVGGDLPTLQQGTYDTPSILGSAPTTPEILGGVKLRDVVRPEPISAGSAPDGAMTLGTRTTAASQQLAASGPKGVEQAFTFKPKLVDDPLGLLHFFDYTYAQVDLSVRIDDNNPETAHYKFQALISNAPPWDLIKDLPANDSGPPVLRDKPAFRLRLLGSLFPFCVIEVIHFVFRAETGKDIDVSPTIGDVKLGGSLRFLAELQNAIGSAMGPPAPKGSPKLGPIVKPQGDDLEVGIKVGVPAFTLGIFTLKNIAFGFSCVLPFKQLATAAGELHPKKKVVRFNFYFSERQNPFLLGVYVFGGGGFFGMGCGSDGMEWLEVAFEFGAHLEMDFKVASGAVEVMAGIYFSITVAPSGDQDITLTGYVRLRGHLSALGIITVSLEMYLGLTYESLPNQVVGQATLTIEVDVLVFSVSVSVHAERRFSGPKNDPGFLDMIPSQDVWEEYARAFAPIGG